MRFIEAYSALKPPARQSGGKGLPEADAYGGKITFRQGVSGHGVNMFSGAGAVLMEEALGELENLRRIRDELEIERVAAGEERMRMLGHL